MAIVSPHKFGKGALRELATKLYKNPITPYREAVSNALDAMVPYENEEKPKVEIFTHGRAEGDIVIEDWGTGIEDYETFKIISPGEKAVRDEISSYEKINPKLIGQKGLGKLSFIMLSSDNKVEFWSNSEKVGRRIIMTDDMENGFYEEVMNSQLALPHRGLKIVIKKTKKSVVSDSRLKEYLGKVFSIRIARGAKIFVNGQQIHKQPEDFDSRQYPLFELEGGTKIYGNLKCIEKPRLNNIAIFVKNIFVAEKNFEYKVQGWINCDQLEVESSRDGILEGNDVYTDFMRKLQLHLDENFEKKYNDRETEPSSKKEIERLLKDTIRSINDQFPDFTKPPIAGKPSDVEGMGGSLSVEGESGGPCSLQEGRKDPLGKLITAKPIGHSTAHKKGLGESKCKVGLGGKSILAPSNIHGSDNKMIPDPRIVSVKAGDDRPVVFFHPADNRLVINSSRPSSAILLKSGSKDPEQMKSRLLPLLVRAVLGAYPGSKDMTAEELFKMESTILDSVWSKSK